MATLDLKELDHQWLLLDANFIMNFYRYPNEPEFRSFFELFKKNNIISVTTEHVVYEILSGSSSQREFDLQKTFIGSLVVQVLADRSEIIQSAMIISGIYNNKKPGNCGAKMVDCMLSAQLKNYGAKIALLTANFKDFPLLLHNRLGVHSIDVRSQVITFGFIRFDEKKFNIVLTDFLKVKTH